MTILPVTDAALALAGRKRKVYECLEYMTAHDSCKVEMAEGKYTRNRLRQSIRQAAYLRGMKLSIYLADYGLLIVKRANGLPH